MYFNGGVMDILKKLKCICETKVNVSLKDYCSIKIGGVGKFICFPKSVRQVKRVINLLNRYSIQYYILGNGTNIVFEDAGYSGVLVSLKKMKRINVKGENLCAYAGASLFYINQLCAKCGLSGLEFSFGIPGTVGGAVRMNAGCFGGEIKDVVSYVWVLVNGRIKKLTKREMHFSYRSSIISASNTIVLKVQFKLKRKIEALILEKMQGNMQKRLSTQPYGTLNAGSIFKKTKNESAGKYIDKLGLKGVIIGDIQISPKHANFFINLGNGSSKDLHLLIDQTRQNVYNSFGESLEQEVIFVGDKNGNLW